MIKRYIGTKAFYRHVLAIALPIIFQNTIMNFVSLLDNIMVGQLTTAQISGVTIANNNLILVFNLCLYGGAAGAGIFTTQYHGANNPEGVRYTFRFKLMICMLLTILGVGLFSLAGDSLIGLYLKAKDDPQLAIDTLRYARQYLNIMMWGFLPYAFTNAYAGTLRECGLTTVPMVASLIATATNLVFNFLLIFGYCGFPAMGVAGAAVATVISRYVELAIVAFWSHTHHQKMPCMKGLYRAFHIPGKLFKDIVVKGMPLLLNELFWSLGIAFLNQCYSVCSQDVNPALSISTTIYNLSSVVFRSMGGTVGIIIGQMLGAGRTEEDIRDSSRKLTVLTVACGVVFGALLALFAFRFPKIYNTSTDVQNLAGWFILISAAYMPLQAYIFNVYFTLRSGGKSMITFLFDSGAIWVVSIPIAFVMCNYTGVSILLIYALSNLGDIVKCIIGAAMMKKGTWIQNLAVK